MCFGARVSPTQHRRFGNVRWNRPPPADAVGGLIQGFKPISGCWRWSDARIQALQRLLEGLDPTVPVTSRDTLTDILRRYVDVFSKGEDDLRYTDFVHHRIDTGKQRPFRQQLRRHPDKYVEAMDEQVKTFLRQVLIRPDRFEWGSIVVIVKNSDGSLRFLR